jgi:AcrR family transcriptional regulator
VTKNKIIEAAFRVWGRDFYRKSSLSSLAKELKVSKPALYRHFLCKNALTTAMTEYFCKDLADSIRDDFEQALAAECPDEGLFTVIRALSCYFGRNVYSLIFNITNIYDRKIDGRAISERIKSYGTDMDTIRIIIEKKYKAYPYGLNLVLATLIFYLANFHKNNEFMEEPPTDEKINAIISMIYNISINGLGFSIQKIDSINFDKLEDMLKSKIEEKKQSDPVEPLFKAVAEAVAEAGPWNTTMDMVAKKMGLSKSSLYSHFKNKKDMLRRLFITEFKRIFDFAQQGISLSNDTSEQLYLAIYSIAAYLHSRSEILVTLDWIRTRKLDLGKPEKDMEFLKLFEKINIDSMQNINREEERQISHWILFLLINFLTKINDEEPDKGQHSAPTIHLLYKFITLGLGGFKNE